MKRFALCLVVVIAGCTQQAPVPAAPTLTALEEYALAAELFDRELKVLKGFRETHDPNIPADKEILDGAKENFELAAGLLHKARARLQEEVRQSDQKAK